MPKNIKYVIGDATSPLGDGNKFIIHVCNDINAWGAGFVLALSKKWPETKKRYHAWYNKNDGLTLGTIQTVNVEKDIVVVNMIGQRNIKERDRVPPVRYGAIRTCLGKVADLCQQNNATVHAPRFGAGLAGGNWNEIESILTEEIIGKDIDVTIYDLVGEFGYVE